jgi:DNA-binding PadR family transcriptional regulator
MTTTKRSVAAAFLPLRANWFHILVSLADGERHGYGIMQEVLDRTAGELHLWPATLYGALRQLLEAGLIEECDASDRRPGDDSRRRYYRITSLGHRVLTAEIARLEGLLRAARAKAPATVSGGAR